MALSSGELVVDHGQGSSQVDMDIRVGQPVSRAKAKASTAPVLQSPVSLDFENELRESMCHCKDPTPCTGLQFMVLSPACKTRPNCCGFQYSGLRAGLSLEHLVATNSVLNTCEYYHFLDKVRGISHYE
jgi:hypothetical protein